MQLTMFTDYSLRTLMYLALNNDRRCTAKEVADSYGISQNHIVKVVHNLTKLGYVVGTKGKGGGIHLAAKPESLKLGALVQRLEPDMRMVECFSDSGKCRIRQVCRFKGVLGQAVQRFLDELNRYSLADMVVNKEELQSAFLRPV